MTKNITRNPNDKLLSYIALKLTISDDNDPERFLLHYKAILHPNVKQYFANWFCCMRRAVNYKNQTSKKYTKLNRKYINSYFKFTKALGTQLKNDNYF